MNNKYVIYVNNQAISVSKEIYKEYWKSIEHERYLTKLMRRTWIYLDHFFDEYEANTLEFKLIQDKDPTRNEVLKMDLHQQLHNAISQLSDDEKDLIIAIYYHDLSAREYARRTNQKQTTVSWKHRKLLDKLKNLMNY